jgi:sodium/hydrogen exchanger 8
MGLLAYMAAAAAELSAVLAVFFAGLTMSHYTWHSMSPAGRSLALHSFRVVSGGSQ